MSDEKIDLGFFGKSLHDGLLSILEKWRPPKMATELECRNALFERLRKFLPDKAKIEKEYRHEGTTLDLYVRCRTGFPPSDDEVFFELKRNLTKKNEFDRLVGQIAGLNPKENHVFVVLFGEVDPALLGRLKNQYSEFLEASGPFGGDPSVTIVEIK
jgi:hypothetical protein